MPEWLMHCVNVLRVYIEQPAVLLVAKGRKRLAQDQAAAAAAAARGRTAWQRPRATPGRRPRWASSMSGAWGFQQD